MNILHFVHFSNWGGVEIYTNNLCEGLAERGNNIIIAGHLSNYAASRLKRNFKFIPINVGFMFNPLTMWRLNRVIKREQINVIHVHLFKMAFTAALTRWLFGLKGTKIVLTRHIVKPGKRSWLYRCLYKNLDTMIFVSHKAFDEFNKTAAVQDESNIKILYNFVKIPNNDSEITDKEDLHIKFHIPHETPIMLFVGSLAHEKGVEEILKAVSLIRHNNFAVVMVGQGKADYKEKLEKMTINLNLTEKVYFYGFTENVFQLLRQSYCTLLPSIVQESGIMALLEGLTCAVPAISTNNGVQPEMINEKIEGLLVPPANAELLAEAMQWIIDNKELHKQMCTEALKKSKNYTYQKYVDQIEKIYREELYSSRAW